LVEGAEGEGLEAQLEGRLEAQVRGQSEQKLEA